MSTADEEFLQGVEAAGWREELPEDAWQALCERTKRCVAEGDRPYMGASDYIFDTEMIDGVGRSERPGELASYSDLLVFLGERSYGRFVPEDIVDVFHDDAQEHEVGFRLGEQTFSTRFAYAGDWLSDAFLDLVTEALEATGVEQRFQVLPVVDQAIHGLFLSDAAYERAQAAGLFPSMDELIADEMGM